MKKILIKLKNKEIWELDADIVAKERAEYYSNNLYEDKPLSVKQIAYDLEFKEAMDDNEELLDWLSNNMDWGDIKDHICLVVKEVDNRAYLFSSADFEVVE